MHIRDRRRCTVLATGIKLKMDVTYTLLMENKTTSDRFKTYHISYLYLEVSPVIFQDIANDYTPDMFGQEHTEHIGREIIYEKGNC
jgi:hypothetical protein